MGIIKRNIILVCFFVILLNQSLGGIQSWDLNEQIGMADNLYLDGSLYPDNNFSIVSIYTPGVSIVAYFFRSLGISDHLSELMLAFAAITLFLTIILFYKIIELYRKPNEYFFEIQIIYTFLLCLGFVSYATEFKPDTIAFLFCFFGLYVYQKNKNVKNMILGAILIGTSIIFKQQSVFFIIGLIFYSLFNLKKKDELTFTILSTFVFSLSTLYLFSFEAVYKYNFKVISDDAFLPFHSVLRFLWDQFKLLILTLCVLIPLAKRTSTNFNKYANLLKNPYAYIVVSIFIGSFISFLKYGGNTGNIQVGLFYASLLFWFVFKDIKFKRVSVLICFLISLISIDLGKVENYTKYVHDKNMIKSIVGKNLYQSILTDSDTYSLSRNLRTKTSKITNHETLKHLNLIDTVSENFFDDFDVIVIKNELVSELKIDSIANLFSKVNGTKRISIYLKNQSTQ